MSDDGKLYIGVGSLSYDNYLPLDVFGREFDELRSFLRSRSTSGSVREVSYGTKRGFKISLDHVPTSIAAIVNSYWYTNAKLEISTDLGRKNFTPSPEFSADDNLLQDPHFLNLPMNDQVPREYLYPTAVSSGVARAPEIFRPNGILGKYNISLPAAMPGVHSSHILSFPLCVASRAEDPLLTAKIVVMALELQAIGFKGNVYGSLDFIRLPNGVTPFNGTGNIFTGSYSSYKMAASISPVSSLLGETTNLMGALSVYSYANNTGEIVIRRAFLTLSNSTFSLPSSVYYGDFTYTSSIGGTSKFMYIANDEAPLRNMRAFGNKEFYGVIELKEF